MGAYSRGRTQDRIEDLFRSKHSHAFMNAWSDGTLPDDYEPKATDDVDGPYSAEAYVVQQMTVAQRQEVLKDLEDVKSRISDHEQMEELEHFMDDSMIERLLVATEEQLATYLAGDVTVFNLPV